MVVVGTAAAPHVSRARVVPPRGRQASKGREKGLRWGLLQHLIGDKRDGGALRAGAPASFVDVVAVTKQNGILEHHLAGNLGALGDDGAPYLAAAVDTLGVLPGSLALVWQLAACGRSRFRAGIGGAMRGPPRQRGRAPCCAQTMQPLAGSAAGVAGVPSRVRTF